MTARLEAWLDQEDARVTAMVRRYGWSVEYIYGDGCPGPDETEPDEYASIPFAYTVGLFGLGHPELLIFNVPPETACGVMNELGERVRRGENLVAGQLVTFDGWPRRILPETVPNSYEIVLGAYRHYDRPPFLPIPVLQLTYDDRSGRFRGNPDTTRGLRNHGQDRSRPSGAPPPTACRPRRWLRARRRRKLRR